MGRANRAVKLGVHVTLLASCLPVFELIFVGCAGISNIEYCYSQRLICICKGYLVSSASGIDNVTSASSYQREVKIKDLVLLLLYHYEVLFDS